MIDVHVINRRIYVIADNVPLGFITEWTSEQLEDGLYKVTISTPTSQRIYFVSEDEVVVHRDEADMLPCGNLMFDPSYRQIM